MPDRVRVPGYTLGPQLGRGGTGVVHEAVEDATGHRVAIKLSRVRGARPTARSTFLREARAARAARHPGLLPLHAAGEHDGWLYLVMDLVDGGTLQEALDRDGPLPPDEAAALVARVAAAAHALHLAGVVHGDIKPANVLLRSDPKVRVPLLADFSLAGSAVHTDTLSRLSSDPRWLHSADGQDGADDAHDVSFSGGTYTYMAPEQWRSAPTTARCDVYALGGLLHAALTGHRPYHDRVLLPQLMHAVLYADPPRPSALVPRVPAELDRVVRTAMAKEPERRFAGADELSAVLSGRQPAPAARGRRPIRPAVAALAALAAGGGIGGYLLLGPPAAPDHRPHPTGTVQQTTAGAPGPGRQRAASRRPADGTEPRRAPDDTTRLRTVCARDLDLRATPGHGGRILSTLRHGQPVTVLRSDDRRVWMYVHAEHADGWVLAQWLGRDC